MSLPLSNILPKFLGAERPSLVRFLIDHGCELKLQYRFHPDRSWNSDLEELYKLIGSIPPIEHENLIELIASYTEEVLSPSQLSKIDKVSGLISAEAMISFPQALALAAYKLHLETGQTEFSSSEISGVFSSLRSDAATVSSNLAQTAKAKTKEPLLIKVPARDMKGEGADERGSEDAKANSDQAVYQFSLAGQRQVADLLRKPLI